MSQFSLCSLRQCLCAELVKETGWSPQWGEGERGQSSALASVATVVAVLPHVCAEGGPPVAATQAGLV